MTGGRRSPAPGCSVVPDLIHAFTSASPAQAQAFHPQRESVPGMPDANQPDSERTNGGPGESPATDATPDPPAKQGTAELSQKNPPAAQRQRLPLPKAFKQAVTEAASPIRKEFPIPDRQQANRAGRLFARALYPIARRGRPQRSDVTKALRLEAEGKTRKEIYRLLGKATHEQQHALREAMRQRKRREGKKKSAERDKIRTSNVTPTNSV